MPGLFSFGERKSSLANKKSKKELKAAAAATAAAAAASAQAAKTIPSPAFLSLSSLSLQLPTMVGISAPILPPKPKPAHAQARTTLTAHSRRRARPLFDPVALATTSTQKLTYERQRGSSNMRKMVLVQNLLNEVYHTWHALMEKPAPQVAAEAFDFEEVGDLEAPVDELLQQQAAELVPDNFNAGRVKRRASLSWRRQGADSAVDLSAALRAHMEAAGEHDSPKKDEGTYEGTYQGLMSDSSDDEEEEDDDDQLSPSPSPPPPPPPRAPTPQPKPGRRVVRRVKSDSTISAPHSPEDDEVPLGHLPFASDHITSREASGAVPAPPVALPTTTLPSIAPAAGPAAKRAAGCHSPLRHAASLDSLKSAAPASTTPLSINTASSRLAKPSMTLIERMEQREREALLLETPHSADSVKSLPVPAVSAAPLPTEVLPPAPLSAPAAAQTSTTATTTPNATTATSPSSLLKKSLELVRGGRKSNDGSGKSKRSSGDSDGDDVPPPPDTVAPAPAPAPRAVTLLSAPAAAPVVAPAPLPYLDAPHLQSLQSVKKKSSLINLKSVFGRRKAAPPLSTLQTASNLHQQSPQLSPPWNSPPTPPSPSPKSVVLAVESLSKPQSPTRAAPPPAVNRSTVSPARVVADPKPCISEPPLPVPRPRVARSGRPNLVTPPSFLASWQPPSQHTPLKTNSLPLPTLDFSAGSFGADILDGFATSESVRRSFFLVDTSGDKNHHPKEASISFLDSAFDFSWDLTL
ncbi:hypothetical protein HDU87_003317 [Geranomyces variabilis]|uniref:Uncharacterized protein n=1 Tax=Geranomyces variabilis TaxID=109894 RepID=A0AAD5TQ53_9FUNG|nr:hypothetical protein HDU87_003317 [Geranomyces variabilis]